MRILIINFYAGETFNGYTQVFTVNTTTWAVTTANDPLEFDTQNNLNNSCYQVDSNHFINFWRGSDDDGFTQVFTVNTTTWAVTTANDPLEFDVVLGYDNSCYQVDSNHFINFWTGVDFDGFTQVFTIELPVTTNIKSINGILYANIKSINGVAKANMKSFNGLT